MRSSSFRTLLPALLAFALFGTAHAAPGSNDDAIVYRVAKGDSLYTLAERNFRKLADYAVVQRLNRVIDPRRLPVGTVLKIPRSVLRQEPIDAVVQSFRGTVFAGAGERYRRVVVGMKVREGDRIETAGRSFVTLGLPDGSNVTLPSRTTVLVERMRRTLMAGSVERLFRIEKGRAGATVTPMEDSHSQFRFSTPVAVSAVRGTRFRMRYDPEVHRAASEVLEGKVAFVSAADAEEQMLSEGFGTANGLSGPVRLFAPPELVSPGRVQDEEHLRFALKALSDATSYHVQIAADAGFIDVLDETTVASTEAILEPIGNGDYFVRATAIDANGLEGLPATYAFQRRLNRIEASAEEARSGRYRQYLFRWRAPDARHAKFRFQLSASSDGGKPLIDEPGLTGTVFVVTDLPAGSYYWRVMTLEVEEGRAYGKWSPFQELRVEGTR